jgi:ribosome-associated translation inhibitor RaiA
MATTQATPVIVQTRGLVPTEMRKLAAEKVAASLRHTTLPLLSARVTLEQAPDPAIQRPALASAHIDLNGRPVLAHAAGETMPEAIDKLANRLKARLVRARRQPAVRHWLRDRGHGGRGLLPLEPGARR